MKGWRMGRFVLPTAIAGTLGIVATAWAAGVLEPATFPRPTIDLGIVCSDAAASKKFYTEAIGLKPAGGFDVPGEMAAHIGLADGRSWRIDVFSLGDEPNAAKLKLMQFADAKPARVADDHIHSALGVRYITIVVPDLSAAIARAAQAGVKPIGEGAAEVPASVAKGLSLVVFKDPDGNFVELVGPSGK